jgi:1-acyl-sn-glycerol-3-phosphate acyltransferase
MKKRFNKTFYYKDEINDDFSQNNIAPLPIKENYRFYNPNKIVRFFNMLFRQCIIIPILWIVCKINYGTKVINKKAFKKVKGKGYFLYANHTCNFDPIHHACLMDRFRFSAIMAGPETFSIKGIGWLVRAIGAFPTPTSISLYKPFRDCIDYHIKQRHKVVIYPEAHIWPYYTGIRNFKSVSFRYPVDLNAPIMVATTTYIKRKHRVVPKVKIYIDGPFYPNNELEFKKRIEDLRNQALEVMKKRASVEENYSVNEYIKI